MLPSKHPKLIFAGYNGVITAINQQTGDLIWSNSLPKTGFNPVVVTVTLDGKTILIGTGGKLRALDALTGADKWESKLEGLGYGDVTICLGLPPAGAGVGDVLPAYNENPQPPSSSSSSPSHSITDLAFIGANGEVRAINLHNGQSVWTLSLKKTGYAVPSILFEDGMLFCGCGGRAFGVEPLTGREIWVNKLKDGGLSTWVLLSTLQSSSGSPQTRAPHDPVLWEAQRNRDARNAS